MFGAPRDTNIEDEEDFIDFPVVFNFYQDKMPFNKLGEINITITNFFENIVVKQLLKEPAHDKFAVAFYHEPQTEEPSCTLIFKRDDDLNKEHGWKYPEQYVQRNYSNLGSEARAEKLINAFHVNTKVGEKFLLFRDESLLLINEDD